MPNETEVQPMSVTDRLQQVIDTVESIFKSGDLDEVKRLRRQIKNQRDLMSKLTGTFDDCVYTTRSGFDVNPFEWTEEFEDEVKTVRIEPFIKRENKGRKAKVVVVDKRDFL